MIDLGDIHTIARDILDENDTPTTPATSVLVITKPFGSVPPTATPSVPAPTSPGQLRIPYTTEVPGRHNWVLSTTDPKTETSDVFHVRTPDPLFIVGLADAKDQLKITASTGEDEVLRGFIAATTRVMEHYVGPIVARTYTERHFGGSEFIIRHRPVLELTSITPVLTGGLDVAVDEVDVDPATGLVLRLDGGVFAGGPWNLAITAGLAIIPENFLTSALMIIQHLWETRRVSRRAAVSSDTVEASDGAGRWYSVPRRALELLTPDRVI